MACAARYAEAWEFVTFWCINSLTTGAHNGANNSAFLSDSTAQFLAAQIEANVGMVLYNTTDGSSGPVTAVTATTITATLTGGTDNDWDTGDRYRIVALSASEIYQIESFLDNVASNLWMALDATGACDCALSSQGAAYLKKLNIIEAGALYQCSCLGPSFSDERRAQLATWADNQLQLLREGKIEVCSGYTGSDFPALDWAEQGWTSWARGKIIVNDIDRNS